MDTEWIGYALPFVALFVIAVALILQRQTK